MEKRHLCKHGNVVWANLTVALMRDGAGRPERFISVVENIDARRRAEAALTERDARSRRSRGVSEGFSGVGGTSTAASCFAAAASVPGSVAVSPWSAACTSAATTASVSRSTACSGSGSCAREQGAV
ncbi:PAS domain S-box protein [Rhodovastum atsumiense]|uniref:PAS domain S-box protein n=1 Tax=Rhodovastum atsumiense TaxID=504468 RepID=A0A5M6IJF0_9PROT|nr:PAS domain S-box protein [Rhodovastum atsumiense]